MKLHTSINTIEKSTNFVESNFSIDATAKAFSILSDGLYSNKVKAVVRELSTNAYDSHIAAGCPEKPFDIELPTRLSPSFSIRDYGTGLSEEDCMSLYTTYFRSNKTDSNDAVGCLGLGSKSPFAYTDQFMVESFFGGEHMTFSAYKNEDGAPVFAMLDRQGSTEPNGLKVSFSTEESDNYNFTWETEELYKHFKVVPNSNVDLDIEPDETVVEGSNWRITGGHQNSVIMGQVCYPIDTDQFDSDSDAAELLRSCRGVEVVVNIGDVDITPSRESLSYNSRTKHNLHNIFKKIVEEIGASINTTIDDCETLWDARVSYVQLLEKFSGIRSARTQIDDIVSWKGQQLFLEGTVGNSVRVEEDNPTASENSLIVFSKTRYRESVNRDETKNIYVRDEKHYAIMYEDIKRGSVGRTRKQLKDWGEGTIYLVRGDEDYLNFVAETLGCNKDTITNVSTLDAPTTASGGGWGRGEASARGWIWQYNSDGDWVQREGAMSVKEEAYYVIAKRGELLDDNLRGSLGDSCIGTLLCVLDNNGHDMSMFDGKILMVTPSKARTMKLAERDNWMPITDFLKDEFEHLLRERRDEFIARQNKADYKLCGVENGHMRVADILLVADATKTENSFKEAAKIIRASQTNDETENELVGIRRASQRLEGVWEKFNDEISEKKVDYEKMYDTMMADHPMLRVMCEQSYNVDLEKDDVKVVSNYIDGIKE